MMDSQLILGDCLNVLPTLPADSVPACVTDPPYNLGFMGKQFDTIGSGKEFQQWCQQWATAVLRVLKPGGYMLSFGGTRTYHRLACAVEDVGFEIRDCILWLYGSGFPKGRGCLKPSYEPVLLCRRPGPKVLPLGIDECRVPAEGGLSRPPIPNANGHEGWARPWMKNPDSLEAMALRKAQANEKAEVLGRWPANLVHDGSPEVLEAFAEFGESVSTGGQASLGAFRNGDIYGKGKDVRESRDPGFGDTGTAARFFYTAKASREERGEGNTHPTVKPLALMEWLVKLVARPGETVLDPFLGSGTTALACWRTDRECVGIERDPDYFAIAEKRLAKAKAGLGLFADAV